MKKFEAIITQLDAINDHARYQDAFLLIDGNNVYVEILEGFEPFEETVGKFTICVEIDDENLSDEYELDLEHNENLDDFHVVKNKEYERLISDLVE